METAKNIVPPSGSCGVDPKAVAQVEWAITGFKASTFQLDLEHIGEERIAWIRDVERDLFVLNRGAFLDLISIHRDSDLSYSVPSTEGGVPSSNVRPFNHEVLANWKWAFEATTVPGTHSMEGYIKAVKDELAAAKKNNRVRVPAGGRAPVSSRAVEQNDDDGDDDDWTPDDAAMEAAAAVDQAEKAQQKISKMDLTSEKGVRNAMRRHVYGTAAVDDYDTVWFAAFLKRLIDEKFELVKDSQVYNGLIACKLKIANEGDWEADYDTSYATLGIVPDDDEVELSDDGNDDADDDLPLSSRLNSTAERPPKQQRTETGRGRGRGDVPETGDVPTFPANVAGHVRAACAMAVAAEMTKMDKTLSSHKTEIDRAVTTMQDLKKLLEARPAQSVPDVSAVLGKISEAAEQVQQALAQKDKIVSLMEEVDLQRNRAQVLLNMAPSIVRSSDTLTNAVLYLVPHVANRTFQKEEVRAMINSCVAVKKSDRDEVYNTLMEDQ
jgi:hypothetical protein